MDVVHERRTGEDRRQYTLNHRYGCERRINTEIRRTDSAVKPQPCRLGEAGHAQRQGADRGVETVNEIAAAFGIPPTTLGVLEHDERANSTEICPACENLTRMNAELKNELAESRENLELYRNQVEDLLQSFPAARGNKPSK